MAEAAGVVVVDHHDSYTWNLVHLVAVGHRRAARRSSSTTRSAPPTSLAALATSCSRPGPGTRPTRPTSRSAARCCSPATGPVLGVCLGMQGLVTAYGGTVGRVEPAHGEVAAVEHDGAGVFAGLPYAVRGGALPLAGGASRCPTCSR